MPGQLCTTLLCLDSLVESADSFVGFVDREWADVSHLLDLDSPIQCISIAIPTDKCLLLKALLRKVEAENKTYSCLIWSSVMSSSSCCTRALTAFQPYNGSSVTTSSNLESTESRCDEVLGSEYMRSEVLTVNLWKDWIVRVRPKSSGFRTSYVDALFKTA